MALKVAILLFDNYTALDVVGPYEVLAKIPDVKIYLVACEKALYKDQHGLKIFADYSINEITRVDVLIVPGGFGIDAFIKNKNIIDWVRKIDNTTQWTTSVCSGALLLAEAGLLKGKNCTTHWRRKNQLAEYSVSVKDARYVEDGKVITSAGVSAGIDMALYLTSKIAGAEVAKAIQLAIEYDPLPPFEFDNLRIG
jgi:transcriptional regulator GlxA family with amidase domain